MPAIAPPETDLWLPTPGPDETWDAHTIHTHYFSLSVPEAELGMYLYLRYQPATFSCQGGIALFRGSDNIELLDMAHHNYQITMKWPDIEGNVIRFSNGVTLDFVEPGRKIHVLYESHDSKTTVDVVATAKTPLIMRGHVIPGEGDVSGHHTPQGGFDQMMHVVGEVVVEGEAFAVDCHALRDRSWGQLRYETPLEAPPAGCTPMYWGDDFIFNEISYEAPDSHPAWEGLYDVDPRAPSHRTGWAVIDGDVQSLVAVRRTVSEYHPQLHTPVRQQVDIEFKSGKRASYRGETIAMCTVLCWPNTTLRCGVARWEDEAGNVTHDTYQEMYWTGAFQQEMKRRARAAV